MTPSSTGDLLPVAAPPADEEPETGAGPVGRRTRLLAGVALLLLAALPAAFGLVALALDAEPALPLGDHALLALTVDGVGRHEVLLGPYSRFGWYHPGPMAAYLLAVPYRLLDGAPGALTVGALVIGGIAAVSAVAVVRRRGGLLVAVWAVLVVGVAVRLLGDEFLREFWNPFLPVLPFLAGVLLCWTAIRGDAWALPLAVVPMSLAVQSHIGYVPAVGAVGAVLVGGLLLRAVRRARDRDREDGALVEQPSRRPRRWLGATVAAVGVGVFLWLPPIVQQLTRTPGNVGVLLDYLRDGSSGASIPLSTAIRAVADEFGKLPAYAVGADVPGRLLLPDLVPPWAIAVGLALFVAALANGVRRRSADVLWLGALTLAVGAAGVAALARVEGLPFPYLTEWTAVVGVLAWITVGLSLLPELVTALGRRVGDRSRRWPWAGAAVGVPLAALATAAALVTGIGTAGADPAQPDVRRLEQAVLADLDRLGLRTVPDPPVVRVDFAGTTRPDFGGTFTPGAGLVLQLHQEGVDVQVSDFWRIPFGERYTERAEDAGYVATLAYSDGTSPAPQPWQQVLAVAGDFEIRGGVPPQD